MIVAVVVTYNRAALLRECLEALLAQTHTVDTIVVVDNHSTDTTQQMLLHSFQLPQIKVFRMRENLGGAGGFFFGMQKAYQLGADYIWAMDDDSICSQSALAELLAAFALEPQASFMASKVVGENGEPMNVPSLSKRKTDNGYAFWYKHLEHGMVEIADATLVSLLFQRNALEKCGLPHYPFFIWGDDMEYTTRLTRHCAPAFFVGRSLVVHKRFGAKALNFRTETNPRTIYLSRYFYRNMLANLAAYGSGSSVPKFLLRMFSDGLNTLFCQKMKWPKLASIHCGFWGFVFGTYGRRAYKKRMLNLSERAEWEETI